MMDDLRSPVKLCVIGWWTRQAHPTRTSTIGELTEGAEEDTQRGGAEVCVEELSK